MTEKQKQQKRRENMRYYGKTANLYPRHPWTEEESHRVLEHTIPDSVLSEEIHRSVKSIQEKRRRLKKAENNKQEA
ncbi:MAG: hypothetical protein LUG49_05735 [Oscillospiraceae bacterium]|nr:hypothetical protein [Oscillospiraceae bacterium]